MLDESKGLRWTDDANRAETRIAGRNAGNLYHGGTEAGGTGKDKIHISIVSINETNEQIRQRASEGRVGV